MNSLLLLLFSVTATILIALIIIFFTKINKRKIEAFAINLLVVSGFLFLTRYFFFHSTELNEYLVSISVAILGISLLTIESLRNRL